MNFDASLVAKNTASLGFILRDHDGNILIAGIKHHRGYVGAPVEEAQACLHGLACAHEYGIRSVIIESYCLELIQMLRNKSTFDNPVSLFVRDIFSLVQNFDFHSWSFVNREGNRVAHDLAHRQPICLEGKMWESKVPEDITARVSDDIYVYVNSHLI